MKKRCEVYGKDKKIKERYEVYGSKFTEKIKDKIPRTLYLIPRNVYRNTAFMRTQVKVGFSGSGYLPLLWETGK